jgi:competence protein ComEC
MRAAYGAVGRRARHHLDDTDVVALAVLTVVAVWAGVGWALMVGAVALMRRPRVGFAVVSLVLVLAASVAGWWSARQAVPRHLGEFAGWVTVVGDPVAMGSGVRATVEVQGERFDVWGYGIDAGRLSRPQGGELVWMAGERRSLPSADTRAAVRHVVGRVEMAAMGDVLPGSAANRAANRLRAALRESAEHSMPSHEAALFTGLVIGDDARQPRWLVQQFRASGLSHLTAVSGQNLYYVLAAAGPVLRRLRPWWRWVASVALIAWFALATRFEPSVLRAGTMAVLGVTAFTTGRSATAVRLLSLAAIALVLLDPVLVHSVGFWLSVGATAGVSVVGPWLQEHLPGPVWLRGPVAVTLAAQLGVALPSVLVFGRLPVVSLVANPLAVPVAGAVMLFGLPVGAVASALPGWLASIVMLPLAVGTRWVATVAGVCAALEPSGGWSVVAWSALLAALAGVALWRHHGSAPRDR